MKTNYSLRLTETAARLFGAFLNLTCTKKDDPITETENMDSVVNMYKGANDLGECGEGFRTPHEAIYSVGVDYVSGPDTDTLSLISYECYAAKDAKIATKGGNGFGTAISFTAPQGAHYHFNLIYGNSSVWFGDNMELRKPYIIKMPGTSAYFQVYIF